ncbi:hypothetical protein ACFLU6_08160 [Acidobacteriota bacterium]
MVLNYATDMNSRELHSLNVDADGNKRFENIFRSSVEHIPPARFCKGEDNYGVAWWEWTGTATKVLFTVLDNNGNKLFIEIPLNPTDEWLDGQSHPSVSWDESNFTIVWAERLNDGSPYGIFMQRVSPGGDLVGDVIQVSESSRTARLPSVVWTGTHYLVFWVDERNSSFGEIFSAAISADGVKLCGDTQVTNGTWINTHWISAEWNGNECGLVWGDQDFSTFYLNLAFAATDGMGNPQEPSKIIIEGARDYGHLRPDLIWDGERYALAWQTQAIAVNFALLDNNGDIFYKYEPLFDCPEGCEWATVAWSGTEYGYAFTDWGYGQKDVSFTEIRCAFPRYRVLRADAKAKLPPSPDTVFETDALPFIDPDPVITQGSFPDLLFYQVEPGINRIRLFKEPDTVSIHEHP